MNVTPSTPRHLLNRNRGEEGWMDSWIGGTQRAGWVMRTWPWSMSSRLTRCKPYREQVSSCRLHHGRSGGGGAA